MNRRLLLVLIASSLSATPLPAQEAKASKPRKEKGFVSLFDGKTFDGWTGNMKHFRIEEGAIVAGTMKEKIPRNEFLTHKDTCGDFELRLKAKLIGEGGNAGIQIRSRRPTKQEVSEEDKQKRIPEHEMIGYQVDMGKAWKSIWWGKLYDESRRRKVLAGPEDEKALEKLVKFDDWNDYRVRARGKRIQIWLNGTKTVDYREAEKDIAASGLIGLQIHGGPPSEAWYRDIRVKKIKKRGTSSE